MKIGFVLQYRRSDVVYAAMRLADFFRRLGHEVSVFSIGPSRRVPRLNPDWDHMVVPEALMSFQAWVEDIHVAVFPLPVGPPTIAAANRAGCKTISLVPWDWLPRHPGEGLRISDTVVAPYQAAANLVRDEYQLDNVVHIPWDCGLPLTRKANEDLAGDRARVLFPVHCSQAERTWPEVVAALAVKVVERCPWVDATISITPKTMQASSLSAVRRVAAPATRGGTVTVLEDPTGWTHTPLVYGRHDLTVWAAELEGFGLTGLESLCMGTPVVAYDVAPMSELIKDGENGRLIPCDLRWSANRVPHARPDWAALQETVTNLLNLRTGINDLRRHTRLNLMVRREKFVARWAELLKS